MSSSESTTESSAKEGESLQRSEAKNDVKNKTYHKAVMKAIKTLTEEKGKRPKGESRKKYTRALRLAERWCIVLQLTSRAEFDKARSIFKPAQCLSPPTSSNYFCKDQVVSPNTKNSSRNWLTRMNTIATLKMAKRHL